MYSFLGFLILVVVIVSSLYLFWGQPWKGSQDSNMVQAREAMAMQDWKKAVSFFDKAIKDHPGNAAAYIGRSSAYLNMGKIGQAEKDAAAAVEKQPDNPLAHGQKALVQKMLQQYDDALRDLNKALQLDPSYSWAYAQRADLYSRLQDNEKALDDANKALKGKGNFVEAYRLRAWILSRMGKCKEASEDFKKVEDLKPNDASTVQDKAWFLMTCPDEKLQDTTRAMDLAQKALTLSEGKDGVVLETLAEAYFRQGDPLEAAKIQKKAIEAGSKNCPDHSCTKEMKERLQKYELAARKETRKAYEILPLDSSFRP